jgi:hypothetical protein
MRLKALTLGLATAAAGAITVAAPNSMLTAAHAASGCNNNVCVYTAYTGSGYQVWAEFRNTVYDGHLDVWGPNLPRQHSPNGYWPGGYDTQRWSASGSGTVCAEGWSRIGGTWNSVGLPCVSV